MGKESNKNITTTITRFKEKEDIDYKFDEENNKMMVL